MATPQTLDEARGYLLAMQEMAQWLGQRIEAAKAETDRLIAAEKARRD